MKKLTLNLDRLCVDSFETSLAAQVERGTIKGYDSSGAQVCLPKPTERYLNTCDWRCERTIVVGPC